LKKSARIYNSVVLISLTLLSLAFLAEPSEAQVMETGFLNRSVSIAGEPSLYQVYLPPNYSPNEEWPIILFLHGAGERGTDGLAQTDVGIGTAIRKNVSKWPAIVVLPQVPKQQTWQGRPGEYAMSALDAAINEFSVDESRIYLTGLSMGGNGTWFLGSSFPNRFAAIVPICGYVKGYPPAYPGIATEGENSDPYVSAANSVSGLPVWIFHGDADGVVSVEESRNMNDALKAVGADVHYTELPGIGHNAWDAAYSNDEMIEWLFSQKKQ
jgi:predicted peptidase